METNSTAKLIKNLERKEITFDFGEKQLFKKYDYYQVINAYKNLFVIDVENIDKIRKNIHNNIDIDKNPLEVNSDEIKNIMVLIQIVLEMICLRKFVKE